MEYKRIQTKKIYEMVADQIEGMITSERLKSGDQLDSVEQLAKNFNVSRSTIREALSALKAMGFIEVKQGEGTFVKNKSTPFQATITLPKKMDQKTLLEIMDARKIIESNAAAMAASKRTDADLQKIKESLNCMEKSLEQENSSEQNHLNEEIGIEADVNFHLAIVEATHNFVLIQMMSQMSDSLYKLVHTCRQNWLSEPSTIHRLYQEHLSIYKAIVEQNATLAQQLMLAHLVKVEQALTKP
jgi:GntR family transcriptional repressor for pyruvate dehydrogenase complex